LREFLSIFNVTDILGKAHDKGDGTLIYEDKENYYRNLRNPWLLILLMFAIFAVAKCSVVFGVLALVSLIPVLVYQTQVMQNKREGKTKEW